MLYVGIALVILTGLGIIFVGARYLLAPEASGKTFGLPTWPSGQSLAWLNLKGIRDVVSGLVLLVPLALGELHLVGLLMFVAALTPLGDALTILRHKGNKTLAYAVHGATALVVVIAGILLLVG
jgi:hypothetical protein